MKSLIAYLLKACKSLFNALNLCSCFFKKWQLHGAYQNMAHNTSLESAFKLEIA